jgi:hypothetical protein
MSKEEMKTYKKVEAKQKELETITCDKCGTKYHWNEYPDEYPDDFEVQEFYMSDYLLNKFCHIYHTLLFLNFFL